MRDLNSRAFARFTITALAALSLGGAVQAQSIVGGSDLLTDEDVVWLGVQLDEGASLVLTNVFDKSPSSSGNSVAFHSAADNLGRTFSVYFDEITGQRFGGYNPVSWDGSISNYVHDSGLGAWIFNLDSRVRQDQVNHWQTYHKSDFGPTFGGGHDIYCDSTLAGGYVNHFSYGATSDNILGIVGLSQTTYSHVEVFTIELSSVGTNYCTPTNNSTGGPASLLASGSDVATANEFRLTALNLPANEPGYILNSMNPGNFPLSSGVLCLGQGKGRHTLQIGNSGADGIIITDIDITALPRSSGGPATVMAGETWYFQLWHRDGSSSNLTNGLSVTFN